MTQLGLCLIIVVKRWNECRGLIFSFTFIFINQFTFTKDFIMALKKKVETAVVEKEVIEVIEAVVEKEVAVEPSAEVVEIKASTALAETKPKSTAVANSSSGGTNMAQYTKEADSQGFEGMEAGGFGTFPIIVLENDGKFSCDEEDWGAESFIAQIQSSRKLFLCKQAGVEKGPCAFTYDGKVLSNTVDECTTVEDLTAAWEEEGHTLEMKEYREVVIEIVQEGHDHEGEFFIAKLPPASVKSFNGQVFIAQNRMTKLHGRPVPFNEIKIEFIVGAKRTSGTNKYYPWKFKPVYDEA